MVGGGDGGRKGRVSVVCRPILRGGRGGRRTYPVAQGGGHAGLVLEGHAGDTTGAGELGGGGHECGGTHEGGDGEESGGLHA